MFFSCRFAFATVEGLSPTHDYQFRVMAENLYGRSEPCEPTGIVKTVTEQEGRRKKGLGDTGNSLLHNFNTTFRYGFFLLNKTRRKILYSMYLKV